jgi:phage virion morphogenesis protein
MTTITINVASEPVISVLNRLTERLGDLKVPFTDVGEYLLQSTDQHFREERAPDGTPWAPNSPVTIERYFAKRSGRPVYHTKAGKSVPGGKKILRDSGLLQDLMRYQATPTSLTVGTDRPYAAMQQFGGTRAQYPWLWGDIPARPFLGMSPEDENEVLTILSGYISSVT